jgi:group I intron endonuclease
MPAGIYKITNIINNKIYIGSSSNISLRWNQHIEKLIYNLHENYKLQNDFNKYGLEVFHFSILEIVKNNKKLFSREQDWIDSIDVESNYNILSYANYEYVDRIKGKYDNILNFSLTKKEKKLLFSNLIICEHEKLNKIGDRKNNLSKSWYTRASKDDLIQLGKNTFNYTRNIIKTNEFYWTTFVSYQRNVAYKGNVKKFISLIDIPKVKYNTLIYLVNLYSNPSIKQKINIDDNQYALNLLLHWIVNVANINKEINIYIPSSRMRKLLTDWIK